ncbi:hypothetical protein DFH79_001379 [Clostridium beijerinckii]|uniref:hypothetical protein n=1 Tax=Clostridium beijerinckii TaxID=1520 RepID=UPI001570033F|nr:hypothetical protein [Clostridium beijerinckii]NRW93126.1 hypothetical protein [Clostridium beijerinckii]
MIKKIKENLENNYLLLITIVFLVPGIAIYLLNLLLKLGCNIGSWIYQYVDLSLVIIDTTASIKAGDYISYYFTIMAIEVTAILSWALLQASKESNRLSEAIKAKEDNRDNEKVKESAMIIYYDLLSKIGILRNLYVTLILSKEIKKINTIEINNDWIKNLSELRNVLSKREIDVLFELYGNFALLQKAQVCSDVETVKDITKSISGKLFIDVLLKYMWMDFEGKIESLLHNKYYIIFRKIEGKINEEEKYYSDELNQLKMKQVNGKYKIHGEYINGVLKNGKDTYYDENGNLIYSLIYKDYKVIKGNYSNYIDDRFENIFDIEFDENGMEDTGRIIIFYDSNMVKYDGNIKVRKYEGYGILYQDNEYLSVIFDGIWEQGKKKEGVFRDNSKNASIEYFNGTYYNDKPYTGEIKLGNLKSFNDVYEYKGTVKEGKMENGIGYTKNVSLIDWSYIERHNDNIQCQRYLMSREENECAYEYEQDDIPDEVKQEMAEESERYEVQRTKENLQDEYLEVVELIETKWTRGNPERFEDDDLNKKYLGMELKKK